MNGLPATSAITTTRSLITAGAAIVALFAAPAGAVVLVKSAFSGGAVASAGGTYSLVATVGEAGIVGETGGGSFALTEGFWGGISGAIATAAPGEAPLGPVVFTNGLGQNAPNPFRLDTDISFSVSRPAATRLDIYDVMGRRVRTLIDGVEQPGRYRVRWDGRDGTERAVGSGVYFYRLTVGDWSDTRKMLRLK